MARIFWELEVDDYIAGYFYTWIVARIGWIQFFDGHGNPYNLCTPSEETARDYVERLWSINSPYRPSAWRRTADGFLLVASGVT